jgi:RNA-directed DNA polymerase
VTKVALGGWEVFRAHVVAYADDFVILSRGRAAEALAWTTVVMTRLGLAINEVKTSLKNARQERFDFLGYSFGPHRYKANGLWYLSASPSKKSVHRLSPWASFHRCRGRSTGHSISRHFTTNGVHRGPR